MKKIFILICALNAFVFAQGQCPQYLDFDTTVCGSAVSKTIDATILESRLCGDSITIVFDDSTTSLNGSGQVYFHTGPEFVPFEGWQNAYTQNAAMQHISTHLWSITFNPRSFYGYSPDSCLNAIACGFTDSGYINYIKCAGTSDIYIVTATGTAVNTCASATFFTATYTHAPVSYHWSDNDTSGVRTFTTNGTYTVTASGVGGCSVTGSVTINLDSKRVSIGDDTIECTSSSYTFVATPGFLSYQWLDANASANNIHTASNPTGGMYWVQAVDSSGCVSSDTASVHLSATGYLSLPATLSSCPGIAVSADASTMINFNGDSLVIVYNAALGTTQLAGDTNIYFHSAPQFYAFAPWVAGDPYTVGNWGQNDGVGRMKSLGNNLWTITIDPQSYYHFSPDTPMLGIWMVFRNFDGTLTGKDTNDNNIYLYTVPNPPTSPFDGISGYHKAAQPISYTWSNGVNTAVDTFTTSGIYHVTVSDGVCSHTDSVSVNFSSSGTINIGADTAICSTLDTVVIHAGAGYAHYLWSNGDTTQSIIVDTAGIYSVTATTALGCVSTGSRRVILSRPIVSLGPDIVSCSYVPVTLTATPGFASYEWIGRTPSSDTITVDRTGSYWVVATDSFGCAAYDTVTVRYSDVLLLNLQDTFSSCPGNFVDLDGGSSIAVYGDSIVIFYDATQGQSGLVGANKVYMHSGPQFYPGEGWVGQYTVGDWGLDDGVGEMDSLGNNKWSITISPQSYYKYSPDSTINGIWMVFRNANGTATGKDDNGNNIFLDLSGVTPTSAFTGVTGIHKEAGTMTYRWSDGNVAPAIAVDSTGYYSVTVSDGTCSHSDTTFVNLTSNILVSIGNDTAICPSGSVTFNPGAGYVSYRWSNGDTTQTITVNTAGTYSVIVTNGSGCMGYDTAVVRVNGTKVNAGPDVTRCNDQAVTLTASSGYVLYEWFGIGASSQTYSAVNDGCYWVEATDSAGCTSYDTVCVSTSGVVGMHSEDTVITCTGSSSSFDASVNISASGDSLVITYDATQDPLSSGLLGASKVYMHSAPQFYPGAAWGNSPYTVGNWGLDNGVGEMDSIGPNLWQITIYPDCYYHYSPDTPLNGIWMVFRNANASAQAPPAGDGNINLLLVGAGSPYSAYAGVTGAHKSTNNITYDWSIAGNTTPIGTFSSGGTYYVTASDGTCTKTDTITVNQAGSPTVNLGDDTCVTPGSTVTLNAGAGYTTYLWNTGASTQSILANVSSTYWVRVTNAAGCTGSDTVIVSTGVTVNLGRDTCINSGGSYLLNAGAGASSYLWNTGATTDTLLVTTTGTYSVVVTEGGCTGSDSVVIGSCGPVIVGGCSPIAYFRVLNVSPANTVTFKDSSINGRSYYWNFGDGTSDTTSGNQAHTYANAGVYTVTLIVCNDTCGCDTFTQHVNVNASGISEILGLNTISLYPNPASNNCTLEISAAGNMDISIDIYDILGALVQTRKWQVIAGDNKLLLDLSDMPSAIYTLTIHSSSGSLTKKLDIIK